jgi:hypothetical protein
MIDRCSNKVGITSQDRLQPMDKWEDYPIKVIDMAPLIMVTLRWCLPPPLVGASFELGDPPPKISLLSLACGRPLGANGSLYCEWRRLHELRVQDPSGARKEGPNRPWDWARPAGLGRSAQAHPGPAWSPLRSRGSSCISALCPLHSHHFDDVMLASKMEVLLTWIPFFYASILGDVPL